MSQQVKQYGTQAGAFIKTNLLPSIKNLRVGLQNGLENKFSGSASSFSTVTLRLRQITPLLVFQTILFLLLARVVIVSIYRLYFHPLRNYPGPLLARITNLYSLYYEWWLGGAYSEHLRVNLHPKYGPVVRSRPNHLRFGDPEAWYKIHTVGYTFIRNPETYLPLNMAHTSFGTDPKVHRTVRAKLSPLFSKQKLMEIEPLVHQKVDLLVEKIKMRVETRGSEVVGRGKVFGLDVHLAFLALVFDIVQDFVAGGVDTYKLLNEDSSPQFYAEVSDLLTYSIRLSHWDRHFPNLSVFLQNRLPFFIQYWISPYRKYFAQFNRKVYASVQHYATLLQSGALKHTPKIPILNLDLIPLFRSNLTLYSFEAQAIITAGSGTTAYVLSYMFYTLAKHPTLQQQLRDEVSRIKHQTGKLDYTTLQTSELLTAFIKESTRLINPVPNAQPRFLPHTSPPVRIGDAIVPPGTTVEMSPCQLLFNESIYGAKPHEFDITRWLSSHVDAETLTRRSKFLVPFGGGSYVCLGLWMAYMEFYVVLAKVLESGLWWELGEGLRRELEGGREWESRDEWVSYKIGEDPVLEVSLRA